MIKSNPSFYTSSSSKSSAKDNSTSNNTQDHALIVDDDNLDALMDAISLTIADGAAPGGFLLDWHSTSGFAVRWIDLVVVLSCPDTSVLYDRLCARGYSEGKVQENMDAEIFGVVAEEAREAWGEDTGQVVELKSEGADDVEENAERILAWMGNWMRDRVGKEEG